MKRISIVALSLLLFTQSYSYVSATGENPPAETKKESIQKKIDSLKKESDASATEKEKLQTELNQKQSEINQTQNTISEIQKNIDGLEYEIATTTANINRLEANISQLNKEIELIEIDMNAQELILGQSISFLYEVSDVTFLEFFFQSKNLEELLNTHSFIELIMDENDTIYQGIIANKEKMAAKKEELTISKLALSSRKQKNEVLKSQSVAQQNSLNQLLSTKQQEQFAIFERIKQEDLREQQASASIIQYIQQLDYLGKLLAEDANGLDIDFSGSPFVASTELVTPLPGYKISSDFGMRFHPVLSYTRMHNGVDLGGTFGEPIFSAGDGVVVFAGPAQGYGNWVVIYHGVLNNKNIYTIYGHMESNQILVRGNQLIKQGEAIAQVGSAGTSTGPHLHFGVAEGFDGNAFNYVDPKLYMSFQ